MYDDLDQERNSVHNALSTESSSSEFSSNDSIFESSSEYSSDSSVISSSENSFGNHWSPDAMGYNRYNWKQLDETRYKPPSNLSSSAKISGKKNHQALLYYGIIHLYFVILNSFNINKKISG